MVQFLFYHVLLGAPYLLNGKLLKFILTVVLEIMLKFKFITFKTKCEVRALHPVRDACLYMGEATLPDPPDPHFLFAIALQP